MGGSDPVATVDVLTIKKSYVNLVQTFSPFHPRETSPAAKSEEKRMFSQASRNSKCTFCMTIKSSSSFDQSTAITRNFIICLIPEIPRDIVCKTLWLFVRRTLSAGPKDVRLKRELTKLYIFLQSVLIKNCFSFFGDHYFLGDHSWTQSAVLRKGRPL